MSFYLRVEGVNLSHFINDTSDLSTTRGGGLLLLKAMQDVEDIAKSATENINPRQNEIDEYQREIDALKNRIKTFDNELSELKKRSNPSEKNRRNTLRTNIKKLSKHLEELKEKTEKLKTNTKIDIPTITKGASWGLFNLRVATEEQGRPIYARVSQLFKNEPHYKHATFVVDLHANTGDDSYQKDRDRLQTINRWQQMQAPSLAIYHSGLTSCAVDKTRPADEPKRYVKDDKKEFVSESVFQRREYGRKQKQKFYKKVTNIDARYTQDLSTLSQSKDKGILDRKIAFIYIDGNDFGQTQRNSKTAEQQKAFDENTRLGREQLLTNILKQIKDDPDWLTSEEDPKTRDTIRIETLLWGGDEIIWVVPAWKGWWMINEFYKQAKTLIQHKKKPLYHATGVVFCHHNAPIHRIDELAKRLADFSKINREKNLITYQILESFDHVGTDIAGFRQSRIYGLGKFDHLLIEAEEIGTIQRHIATLKDNENFARRKIYQIVQAYKNEGTNKAEEYIAKLPEDSREPLSKLQNIFGGENAHWLHLMDLWDYMEKEKEKEEDAE